MIKEQLIAAIDRKQTQVKPLLANSVFKNAKPHDIMMIGGGEISGNSISFVVVKGQTTWVMYFSYGQKSPESIAENGMKAQQSLALKLIDCEEELTELYRK